MSLAVPEKEGLVLFDGDEGCARVTVGEVVSTVNVTGALSPVGFPSELSCLASAVNVCLPLERAGLALLELQAPPVPVALAVETTVPLTVEPE